MRIDQDSKFLPAVSTYNSNNFLILAVPGDPPTSIVVTNTSAYSLFIEWEPPYTPNGIIVNYTIYLDYNNGTTDIRITDYNTNEYLLEGLSPHQLVGVEMTANTSIGEGPTSAIEETRTHQAGKKCFQSYLHKFHHRFHAENFKQTSQKAKFLTIFLYFQQQINF